ncbi:MAG: hypothetical protein IKB50_02475 [Clostridia bacterium]|nr:hypothetical protein [Clostridia bacterium]
MKRLFVLFSLVLSLILSGCNTSQPQQAEKGDFKFCSLEWGTDWETVQKSDIFKDAQYEVTENGHRQVVWVDGLEYLGVKSEMAGLVFDVANVTTANGLSSIFFQFSEEDEEVLLSELTELYGERKTAYLDKNGVENPINPAGWVSEDTVESVLTEEGRAYYISMFPEDYEQTRLDANLRSPLVSIRFDEERNFVEFNGSVASVVSFVQSEMKK